MKITHKNILKHTQIQTQQQSNHKISKNLLTNRASHHIKQQQQQHAQNTVNERHENLRKQMQHTHTHTHTHTQNTQPSTVFTHTHSYST